RIRTGPRRDRVEVINGDVRTHLVVHPDRAPRVSQPLEETQRSTPRPAGGVHGILAGRAIPVRIDALGAGRLPAQAVEALRLEPVRVADGPLVGVTREVEVIAAQVGG